MTFICHICKKEISKDDPMPWDGQYLYHHDCYLKPNKTVEVSGQ